MMLPITAPAAAPIATFLASPPLRSVTTASVATSPLMVYVSPPKVTLRTSNASSASSPVCADVFDFVTTSDTREPDGIDTPFVALTTALVVVLILSPTASVFEQTFSPLVRRMLVPEATVPLIRAEAAGSCACVAGAFEAVLPSGFGFGLAADTAGRDAGAGLAAGECGAGARPATSGASAVLGAGGTTSTLATESRIAGRMAESVATAAAGGVSVVFVLSPPHALNSSSAMAVSGVKRRVISSVFRMCSPWADGRATTSVPSSLQRLPQR